MDKYPVGYDGKERLYQVRWGEETLLYTCDLTNAIVQWNLEYHNHSGSLPPDKSGVYFEDAEAGRKGSLIKVHEGRVVVHPKLHLM